MDYARVLLMVLWQDCCFLLMSVTLMSALLIPTTFITLLIIGRVHEGAPFRIVAMGTLYGWFSGILGFVGIGVVASILNPNIELDLQAWQTANGFLVISYAVLSVFAAAQAFQYVEYHYNHREEIRPRKRFAFTLRSFFVGQIVLALLIAWWATSRREAIASHYERAQLHRYEANAEKRFGRYGWSTRVVLPSYETECQLELYLFNNEDLEGFDDDVLKEFQRSDHVSLLQVNSPNLTDEGLATIGKLHSLEGLSIRSNNITDAGLARLKELPMLYELAIDSDRLTREGLEILAEFPSLQRVTIAGDNAADHAAEITSRLQSRRAGLDVRVLRTGW